MRSYRNTRCSGKLFVATDDTHRPNELSPITRMSSFRSMGQVLYDKLDDRKWPTILVI
jgi:hypothetical protein